MKTTPLFPKWGDEYFTPTKHKKIKSSSATALLHYDVPGSSKNAVVATKAVATMILHASNA
jgi:hypothetical protein